MRSRSQNVEIATQDATLAQSNVCLPAAFVFCERPTPKQQPSLCFGFWRPSFPICFWIITRPDHPTIELIIQVHKSSMFLSEFRDWWRARGSLFSLKQSAATQREPNVATIEDDFVLIRVENNSNYRLNVSLTSDKIPKSSKCLSYQARTQVNVTFDQIRRTIILQW